ncbi:MAG: hypothetical protein ACE5GW_07835, partial [Planctomycetota bacterium]
VASAVEAGLGFDPLDDASHPAIFLRGDVDLDGVLGLEDALGALAFLFLGEGVACQEALDVNDDHHLDLADPAQLLGFIFGVGPAPADPFPVAGPDPDPEGGLPCAGEAP